MSGACGRVSSPALAVGMEGVWAWKPGSLDGFGHLARANTLRCPPPPVLWDFGGWGFRVVFLSFSPQWFILLGKVLGPLREQVRGSLPQHVWPWSSSGKSCPARGAVVSGSLLSPEHMVVGGWA